MKLTTRLKRAAAIFVALFSIIVLMSVAAVAIWTLLSKWPTLGGAGLFLTLLAALCWFAAGALDEGDDQS